MADTKYIDYITKENDRWDSIAWDKYGDVAKMNLLIEANPQIPADAVLTGGIRVLIPIIPASESLTDAAKLPPWKR